MGRRDEHLGCAQCKKDRMEENKSAIIVGAGLVGSLWAVYLSKAGYSVTIYERRSDIRRADISAG